MLWLSLLLLGSEAASVHTVPGFLIWSRSPAAVSSISLTVQPTFTA